MYLYVSYLNYDKYCFTVRSEKNSSRTIIIRSAVILIVLLSGFSAPESAHFWLFKRGVTIVNKT